MAEERILILGGTREASALAGHLVDHGHQVITSLAGRTREPEPVKGEMRVGGFGGVDGLTGYLLNESITRVIDATHPFASRISANIQKAATLADIRLDIETRPAWKRKKKDRWIEVATLEEAVEKLPAGARAFLALGSQYIDAFSSREDVEFIVRMIDPPQKPLPLKCHEIITAKPGSEAKSETKLFKAYAITHLVCRNSGGNGAYARIEAAREMKLPVIMIGRPV